MNYFTQPNSPGVRKDEIATLEVAGTYFSDWETVWIRDQWETVYPEFRFTCAERDKPPDLWTKLQFKPRDECKIWLANVPAVTGVITVRQTAYDANTHGVSLQGVGISWYAARASIVPTEGMNYEGGLYEVAEKVIRPTGIHLRTLGIIPTIPFDPPVHPSPGETIFSFIERIARDRNVIMGSTTDGEWLLIGEHSPKVEADVTEGFNILSAQVVINDAGARSEFIAGAQKQANDQSNMGDAANQQARVQGDLGRYSPLYVPIEHPVKSLDEVKLRADFEAMWNIGDEINATIVVPGWFNPRGGGIWRAGMAIRVYSPMAMLDQVLSARSVTFTQDRQSGSRTTLDLVQPWRVRQLGFESAAPPHAPGAATSSAGPNPPPPTLPVPPTPPAIVP